MEQRKKVPTITGLITISLAFILSNLRATMFVYLHPDTSTLGSPAWMEILLWLVALVLVIYDVHLNNRREELVSKWRRNWVLGFFVALALLSTFWSIGTTVTLYRSLELLFATLVASYIGIRYLPETFMESLFWFGVVLLIFCIAIVYSAPATGVMDWSPYNGAWRGIYWNRNHLASIAALWNALFLNRLIGALDSRSPKGLFDGVFYILSLGTLYFAKSATGFIVVIVLHFCVLCAWLWIKFADRLQKQHYTWLGVLFLAGSALVLTNLDFVFGLFNRSPTMTGRVDLWLYLWNDVIPQRFWLGHGFGAIWTDESFRITTQEQVGWGSQVLIADNGYLDILLHVGILGFVLFAAVLVTALVRSVSHAIVRRTLTDFVPLLIMIFALVSNMAFSLFAETEVFVWMLIVIALFMTTLTQANVKGVV